MHCPWLAGWQITGAKALSSSRVLPPPVVTKKEADQRALTKKSFNKQNYKNGFKKMTVKCNCRDAGIKSEQRKDDFRNNSRIILWNFCHKVALTRKVWDVVKTTKAIVVETDSAKKRNNLKKKSVISSSKVVLLVEVWGVEPTKAITELWEPGQRNTKDHFRNNF